MARSWRIVKTKWVESAFDGEGARRNGGRWNSEGTRLVYTSATQSLAALEMLVHMENEGILYKYSVIPVSFDDELVQTLALTELPSHWSETGSIAYTRKIGDTWVKQQESLVLCVPSAVVPNECNYLINPAHVDFKAVQIGAAQPFPFDPRLLKAS